MFNKLVFVVQVVCLILCNFFILDTVFADGVQDEDIVHNVVSGDSLNEISDVYNISIGAIAYANSLVSDIIYKGQRLIIPTIDSPINPYPGDNISSNLTYVVETGDTLGDIARTYGSTVDDIVRSSELLSTVIKIDQFLTIPFMEGDFDFSTTDAEDEQVLTDDLDILTNVVGDGQMNEVGDLYISLNHPKIVEPVYDIDLDINSEHIESMYGRTFFDSYEKPVDFVERYWNNIGYGNYSVGWKMLSDDFRQSVHQNEFEGYLNGYMNLNLCNVVTNQIKEIESDIERSLVQLRITYLTGEECAPSDFVMTLGLTKQIIGGFWRIDSVTVSIEDNDVLIDISSNDEDVLWIDVNIGQQKVYAMQGDRKVREFVVSTGTDKYPTVTGNYNIYVKYLKANMSGVDNGIPWFLADVPYVMYFYSGYGLHGTYWHDNFGTPMSHGCINLNIEDAEWLYDFAGIGTLVYIHY